MAWVAWLAGAGVVAGGLGAAGCRCRGATRVVAAVDAGGSDDAGLAAAGPALRGQVTDQHGAPLARVRVLALAVDGRGLGLVDTGADGRFELAVPAGPVHLETRAPGRVARAVDVVAPGEVAVVAMAPGVALGGVVTAAADDSGVAGAGLAGALVVVRPEAGWLGKQSKLAAPVAAAGVWRDAALRSARSGPGGGFALSGLASGFYRVTVQAAGFAPVEVRHVVAPGLGLEVALAREVVLVGRVVDAAGAPAAGARVEVAGSGLWPPRTVETDAAGAFKVERLLEGIYEVRARRGDSEASQPLEGVERFGGGAAAGDEPVTLVLAPARVMTGRVVDATTGQGVAGARVSLARDVLAALADRVETGADGGWRIAAVAPGEYVMAASAKAYLPVWGVRVTSTSTSPSPSPSTGPGPGAADVTLALLKGARISGFVRDGAGGGVKGAVVEVFGIGAGGTLVPVGAGERSLAQVASGATDAGRLRAQGELGVLTGPIPYPPPRAAGAAAVVVPTTAGGGGLLTAADGSFVVEGIPPGRVRVVASHPDLAAAASAELVVKDVAEVTLVLRTGAVLAGRVTDDLGRPLGNVLVTAALASAGSDASASVAVDDEGGAIAAHIALTDPDGRYRIAALAGAVRVEASLLGYLAARRRVAIPAAAADSGAEVALDLTLTRADRELGGRVIDPLGFALLGARIRVLGLRDASAQTIDGGYFTLARLGPPPWRLEVSHPDYPARTLTVSDDRTRAELALAFGGGVTGRVTDARTRAAIPGVELTLSGPAAARAQTRPDASGAFTLVALGAGSWTLTASAPGHAPARRTVTIPAATRDPREITVRDVDLALEPAARIAGRVLDVRGTPVAGAGVTLTPRGRTRSSAGAALPSARTDAAGHYVLSPIPEGDYDVVARWPQGHADYLDLRLHAGDDLAAVDLRAR
ncbi:MAG: carboxypeptidase regulatory-like domain-containing protein [Deltaproteobacteria bacterium]|nr:carboxypeptidase regulatory-like domain-containing protein [Deltaproteobacteria bacterium]